MFKLTNEIFYEKCRVKYGDRYTYHNDFTGIKNKLTITCIKHGDFTTTADHHLHGKDGGCKICQKEKLLARYLNNGENFIKKSEKVHKKKYDYSKVNYINNETNVTIICKEHGEFKQRPTCHLNRKQGCPKCSRKTMGGHGGYNIKNAKKFEKKWLTISASLYLVNFSNDNESFLKIGITTQKNIRRRFSGLHLIYNIEIIKVHQNTLYDLIFIEKKILEKYKTYRYSPKNKFKGSYECFELFTLDFLKNDFEMM